MKSRFKKWQITLGVLLLVGICLFVFRNSVLRGLGNYLIDEDELQKVEVLFVLGGVALDRGDEAARLYHDGFVEKIVTSGANYPGNLMAFGIEKTEAEVTALNIVKRNNVPKRKVEVINEGTSTKEEAAMAVGYCQENGIQKAMVLSNHFHTSRVRSVFEPVFEEAGIELLVCGAPATQYEEDLWWQTEQGLIMVNNEYMKKLYYWLKY